MSDPPPSPSVENDTPTVDLSIDYDNLPSGHPALRPWTETVYISRDAEMDAEEARLRFALLAAAPQVRHGHGLEAARAAVLGLPGVADDGLMVRRFAPESFLVVFSAQQPMEAALHSGGFTISTTRFIFRRWTRLIRAEVVPLYRRVSLEIEGVPAHAWSWRVARKVLASSCCIESMDPTSENKIDMSKIAVTAWCHEPSRIPLAKTLLIAEHGEATVLEGHPPIRQRRVLMYRVLIHLRRIEDYEPRPPPPPSGAVGSGAAGSDHGEVDDHHNGGGRGANTIPRVRTFVCTPGVVDGQPGRSYSTSADAGAVSSPPRVISGEVGRHVKPGGALRTTLHGALVGSPSTKPATAAQPARPLVVSGAVRELVPLELQCSRIIALDSSWEDPMLFEHDILHSSTTQRATGAATLPRTAGQDGTAAEASGDHRPCWQATTSRLKTYQRRSRASATVLPAEVEAPLGVHATARDPPVTPTRLDFDCHNCQTVSTSWAQPSSRKKVDSRPRSQSAASPSPATSKGFVVETSSEPCSPDATMHGPAAPLATPPLLSAEAATTTPQSPSTAAAIAATSAFLAGITLATRSPLIAEAPQQARVAVPRAKPAPSTRRSERLANQSLNLTVRPSKKGEVLAMKRLGFLGNEGNNLEQCRKEFDLFFTKLVDIKNFPAIRDLLPAARELSDEELLAAAHQAGVLVEGF